MKDALELLAELERLVRDHDRRIRRMDARIEAVISIAARETASVVIDRLREALEGDE